MNMRLGANGSAPMAIATIDHAAAVDMAGAARVGFEHLKASGRRS